MKEREYYELLSIALKTHIKTKLTPQYPNPQIEAGMKMLEKLTIQEEHVHLEVTADKNLYGPAGRYDLAEKTRVIREKREASSLRPIRMLAYRLDRLRSRLLARSVLVLTPPSLSCYSGRPCRSSVHGFTEAALGAQCASLHTNRSLICSSLCTFRNSHL